MADSFGPSIHTKYGVVTPKGYEWILGFALAGCQWAIDKANEPGFREMVLEDLTQGAIAKRERQLEKLMDEINELSLHP